MLFLNFIHLQFIHFAILDLKKSTCNKESLLAQMEQILHLSRF